MVSLAWVNDLTMFSVLWNSLVLIAGRAWTEAGKRNVGQPQSELAVGRTGIMSSHWSILTMSCQTIRPAPTLRCLSEVAGEKSARWTTSA